MSLELYPNLPYSLIRRPPPPQSTSLLRDGRVYFHRNSYSIGIPIEIIQISHYYVFSELL